MLEKNYKKVYIFISLFIVLAFSCVFSACQNIPSFNWQENGNISFSYDPYTLGQGESFNAVSAENENAIYIADKDISEKRLNKTVTNIENILDLIKPTEKIDFYIYDNAGAGFAIEKDGTNFVCISPSSDKLDIIIAVLQGAISPYANYGLLYGKASLIHEKLGWGKIKTVGDKKIKEFISNSDNADLLDLNYPCFKEKYCKYPDRVKTIAVKFVCYLENKFGEAFIDNLIKSSANLNFGFEHIFAVYMNEFLSTLDGKYFVIPSTRVIRYSQYIEEYPLRIRTVSCDYCIVKDYRDRYFNDRGIYSEFDYRFIKNFFWETERMYEIIRRDFGYEGSDKVQAIINQNDSFCTTYSVLGLTNDSGNFVAITPYAAVHEYVHAIQVKKFGVAKNWVVEALAEYYDSFVGYKYSVNRILEYNFYKYYSVMDSVNIEQKPSADAYLKYMKDNNLVYNRKDFIDLVSYLNPDISPFAYSAMEQPSNNTMSFLIFLIDNYGIEKTIKLYYMSSSFDYVFEKSSNELISEWKEYLRAKFDNIL